MHILVLSQWYYPEPVAKPHELAKGLVARGHRVTVITGLPNYPQGKVYDGYEDPRRHHEQIDGVDVIRLRTATDRSRSAARRVLSYGSFSAAAFVRALAGMRPDVVWTYQIGLPGALYRKVTGRPLVHEVQDLWPEWSATGGMGLNNKGVAYRVLDAQQRFIYRAADAITTISEGFRGVLLRKGVPEHKIEVIPNWANEADFRPTERDAELGAREGLAGRFNVMYAGNVGTAQGLDVVLGAAGQLRDASDVQFVVIGDGVERARLEGEARQRGLENVRFLGSRPQAEMAHYLAFADALLIHLLPDPFYSITIPSKTYAYLASGRPVLAAATGEVETLIRSTGAGLCCRPGDPPALVGAIRTLQALSPGERAGMGQAGRTAFLARFSRGVLVGRYEDLFGRLLEDGKAKWRQAKQA